LNREELKTLLRQILQEEAENGPIKLIHLPLIRTTEEDRLDTGDPSHRVFTHDVLSLEQSPRLGCGIMEMERTTFPWTLNYDEIDYVISGSLSIHCGEQVCTANAGEMLMIPKGSNIRFSVPDKARFLYVTYAADWQSQ